jgi:hypothetical protein
MRARGRPLSRAVNRSRVVRMPCSRRIVPAASSMQAWVSCLCTPVNYERSQLPSLRKGGGLVDAPGRGLVGAKGEYPLRASYLPIFLRAGVGEDVVMKLGGWRTRSMLTRYNIVSGDDLADAQERLTTALATATPRVVPAHTVPTTTSLPVPPAARFRSRVR